MCVCVCVCVCVCKYKDIKNEIFWGYFYTS